MIGPQQGLPSTLRAGLAWPSHATSPNPAISVPRASPSGHPATEHKPAIHRSPLLGSVPGLGAGEGGSVPLAGPQDTQPWPLGVLLTRIQDWRHGQPPPLVTSAPIPIRCCFLGTSSHGSSREATAHPHWGPSPSQQPPLRVGKKMALGLIPDHSVPQEGHLISLGFSFPGCGWELAVHPCPLLTFPVAWGCDKEQTKSMEKSGSRRKANQP